MEQDRNANHTSRRDFIKSIFPLCAAGGLGFNAASDKAKSSVRFGIVTDLHYADRPAAGTRFYRDSLNKIKEST